MIVQKRSAFPYPTKVFQKSSISLPRRYLEGSSKSGKLSKIKRKRLQQQL